MGADRVDRLVTDMKRLRPDIDPQLKAVSARLLHLSDLVLRYYGSVTERFEVSISGLGVMTALTRHAPRALTLSEINRDILVTSGGITFVVNELEKRGLLTKRPHPADGRAVLVQLTSKGRRLAGQLIDAVAAADAELFARVGVADRRTLERLLKYTQVGIEAVMPLEQEAIRVTSVG